MYNQYNKSKSEQIAKPSDYPQGYFKDKPCKNCNIMFSPNAPCELYCCDTCKDRGCQSAYFKRNYGITCDDYERMLYDQNELCAICYGEGFIMDHGRHQLKLVVDHCHSTGVVRGLLCHNCNRALGLLKDDTDVINRAIEYLKVQRPSKACDQHSE